MKKITDHIFTFSPQHMLIEMADDISDIEKANQEYDSYRIENAVMVNGDTPINQLLDIVAQLRGFWRVPLGH